jgi:diguanylate cyclase (GGDEF)-like protein
MIFRSPDGSRPGRILQRLAMWRRLGASEAPQSPDTPTHLGEEAGAVAASLLLKANERLLLASIRAQIEAESAAEAYQEIARRAEHDPLTQLPNRVLLLDRFDQAIAGAKRHGSRLALLFIDLDDFKQINDAHGHGTGDQVLRLVAKRLTSSVREADTVSRHGGDEFLILLPEISQPSDAALIAEKVLTALGAPAIVGDHIFLLSASVGVSTYPEDGFTGEELIERADGAMYRAKGRKDGSSHVAETQEHLGSPVAPRALNRLEQAILHYEATQERLIETNRRLSAEVESARGLLAEAQTAHLRQTAFMAGLAQDLNTPLLPSQETSPELEHRVAGQQPVDMSNLIDDVVIACRSWIEAREQHLSVQLPTLRHMVLGDSKTLTKAIYNLLENASKYTQTGGDISVLAKVVNRFLEVTVSDNGRGIDAPTLAGLFQPFVRAPQTAELGEVGLGLGLTQVRQSVEAHGGRVAAASAGRGLGSQFLLTLPLIGAALASAVPFHGSEDWLQLDLPGTPVAADRFLFF